MKDKKRWIIKTAIVFIVCILLLLSFIQIAKILIKTFGEKGENGFLSSTVNQIQLYEKKEETFQKTKRQSRGTPIFIYEKGYNDGAISYTKIKLNDKIYYVKKGFTTVEKEKIVKEKDVYVRTNAAFYYKADHSSILSSLPKGTALKVIGYHGLQKDGNVSMYKVSHDDKEGYIYAKYVVQKKEDALLSYNENGIYDLHKTRGNLYGGGSAASLDYYPFSKVSFQDNVMPKDVHALYINASAVRRIDDYIALAKKNNINAFVIDIKEDMSPAYASLVMRDYSKTSYQKAVHSFDSYQTYVKRAIDAGFYVIGRISVFKDHYYAVDHPKEAIMDTRTHQIFSYHNTSWPSAYSRDVWEYNVELAKESASKIGFHEIQFDYVRFPDKIGEYEKSGAVDLLNTYGEEKASAIQQFLMYARDELHSINTYLSVSVFGESANAHVTSYGQYWPGISNVVDVISAMPYPDHFEPNAYGFSDVVWKDPYALLMRWGKDAFSRQEETPSPAVVRTWIQGYDATNDPYILYDASKVSGQIRALYQSKLDGGYMVWNAQSSLDKYKQIASAFQKEYGYE